MQNKLIGFLKKTFLLLGVILMGSYASEGQLRAAAPNNDNCVDAVSLSPNTTCNFQSFTTDGANANSNPPSPGCGGTPGKDVWFKFTAPSSGSVFINSQSVSGNNGMSNGAMALYSGTCNNLALIDCDDNSSDDGYMPEIYASGLTAGTTYYIRFWGENNDNGDFKICIRTPAQCDLSCVNPINYTNATYNNSNNTIELCANLSTILSINSACLNGFTNITYQWKFSSTLNGTYNNITNATNSSLTINNTNNGTGFYQLVINFTSGGNNCTQTITQAVTFYPLPNAPFSIGGNGGCSGSSVSFNSNATIPSGNSISTYDWDFGDGSNINHNQNPTHNFHPNSGNGNQSYNVQLTVTSNHGCTTTVQQTVSIGQAPDATLTDPLNITPFVNCSTTSTSYDLTVQNSSTSSNSNYQINWGDNTTSITSMFSSDITHTYPALGS